jgi:hypothetical protein
MENKILIFCIAILCSLSALGSSGEILLDSSSAVVKQNVIFEKKYLVDLSAGSFLDEQFANANYTNLKVSYFYDQNYLLGLGLRTRSGGNTSLTNSLLNDYQVDLRRAPIATTAFYGTFGYALFYGKLSLTKNTTVTNSSKVGIDLGMQTYGQTRRPFIQTDFTQYFYIGKSFSISVGLGLSFAEVTDPTSFDVRTTQPISSEDSFGSKVQMNHFIAIGVGVLL